MANNIYQAVANYELLREAWMRQDSQIESPENQARWRAIIEYLDGIEDEFEHESVFFRENGRSYVSLGPYHD